MVYRAAVYGYLLLGVWVGVPQVALAEPERIFIASAGGEYLLELPSLARDVDIEDSAIASVQKTDTKAKLLIRGKKTGETTLKVRLVDGGKLGFRLIVGNMVAEAKRKLSSLRGLKVVENNGRLNVSGTLDTREDQLTLQEIKSAYGSLIVDESDKTLASEGALVRTINRVLKENDLQNFEAHAYGKIVALEGSPKDPRQAEFALRIARLIYADIENRISQNSVGGPAISIELIFVELDKTDVMDIGFKNQFGDNPDAVKGGIAQSVIDPIKKHVSRDKLSLNWQVGGLTTFLKLVQSKTSTRVLSNPRLIARTGASAKFHAGTTVFLERESIVNNVVTKTFEPVDTGILLSITPKIDEVGQIDSVINTEVSEFSEISTEKQPAINRSSVDTAVTIRDGQTILLSGLHRKKNHKSVDRVPILADVPIVGELFKNRSTNDRETEMLILVTMNRIRAFDEQAKASGERLWERAGDDVEFSFFD